MTNYNGFMMMTMMPPHHFEYEMTMTMMPHDATLTLTTCRFSAPIFFSSGDDTDVIEKSDGVMMIWPSALMTPTL